MNLAHRLPRPSGSVSHPWKPFVFSMCLLVSGSIGAAPAPAPALVPTPSKKATFGPFDEAISDAMAANHAIRAATANLNITRERYDQSLGNMLPDLSLSVTQSHRFMDDAYTNQSFFNDRSNDNHEVLNAMGVNLAQPLFKWPLMLALEQTEMIISTAQEELNEARQNVLLETIQTIITVLLTENMAKLAKSNLHFTRRNLKATLARRKAGYLTRTDVDQATARVSSAEAERIHAENEAMVARARFEEVVRASVPEGLGIPDVPPHLLEGSLEELFSKIEHRPDIRAARFRLETADYTIRMNKAEHLPVVDLSANASNYRGGTGGQEQEATQYGFSVQLSVPLFSGGKTQSRVREATHAKTSSQITFDRVRDQALREIKQAYLEMHSAKATVTSAKAAFKFYKEALKGMKEEFRAGFRSVIDLLESQTRLFRSEADLVQNHYELLSSQYQLLHTIGLLTPENLARDQAASSTTESMLRRSVIRPTARWRDSIAKELAEMPIMAKHTEEKIPPMPSKERPRRAIQETQTQANHAVRLGATVRPLNAARFPVTVGQERQVTYQATRVSLRLTHALGLRSVPPFR